MQLALVVSLYSALLSAAAADSLQLDARLMWGGWGKPARAAEAQVALSSPTRMSLQLGLHHASGRYTRQLSLTASSPAVFAMPIASLSAAPAEVEIMQAGKVITQTSLETQLLGPGQRLAVVSTAEARNLGPSLASIADLNVFHASAHDFPQHLAGFGPVDLLVMDRQALTRLDTAANRAVQQYLAQCGRMLWIGAPPAAMQSRVSCQSRYVRQLQPDVGPAQLNIAVQALLALPAAPKLPATAQLARLLPQQAYQRLHDYVGLLLAGYLLAITAALLLPGRHITVPVLAVLAALLTVLAPAAPATTTVSLQWSSAWSGDTTMRSSRLMQVTPSTKQSISQPLPAGFNTWATRPSTATIDLDRQHANWQARLMQVNLLHATASPPHNATLQLTQQYNTPLVTNRGATASPAAILTWRADKYRIPALAPGQRWQPREPERWSATPVEQLFRQQTARDAFALLMAVPTTDQTQHWQVLRP